MQKRFFILLFFLLFTMNLQAKNGGFQLWNNVTFNHELTKSLTLSAELTARFREHPFRVYYYNAEFDLFIDLPCDWELGIGHQVQYEKDKENRWDDEQAPMASLTKKWKFDRYTLSNRNRFEYTIHFQQLTYRNRLKLEMDCGKWVPVVFQEFFFDEGEGYNENRLFIGAKRIFNKSSHLKMGYLLLLKKPGRHWDYYNSINWNFSVTF